MKTRKHSPHPCFGEARWIWPAALGRPVNHTVEFRQTFSCDSESGGGARLAIAADTVYAIWINGAFIDSGRCPDVPPERGYDVIPVGAALKRGRNELVVGLYVQGVDSSQHLPGDPGLVFALRGRGVEAFSGRNSSWREDVRYRSGDMPRISGQLGFSFEFNASRDPAPWRKIAAGDLGARAAEMALAPRPIARTAIGEPVGSRIVAQGLLGSAGDDSAASPSCAMQRDPMEARVFRDVFVTPADPALPSEDGLAAKAETLAADGFYVVVDLGREEAGFATFDFEADAGTVVDIGHGEHLNDLRVRAFVGNRNFASRYVCREGRQTFTHIYRRMAGRYIQLNVRDAKSRFTLHYAGLLPALYPLEEGGAFAASDRLFDAIYATSVRTLRLCMHEHYEDCPWREQAMYANDSRNQALAGYYAFGEGAFPAAAFTLLGKGLKPDGWLEMCMPASIAITIPSFTFAWILAVGDHWLHRGDRAFAKRSLPVVRAILEARERELRDGLLPCPPGQRYWQFYDWAPGLDGRERIQAGEVRFDAPLNLFFLLALRAGATVAEACGSCKEAARWRSLADAAAPAIHGLFWASEWRAYRTYSGDRGFEHACELTQALALLAGVAPSAVAGSLLQRLSAKSDWVETTLSQSLYKYEALLGDGDSHSRAVFAAVSAEWGAMLFKGATSFWETRLGGEDFAGGGSQCHGWSATPAYLFGAYALGVRPLEPGFAAFRVAPLESGLDSASGAVPTPHGPIVVSWRRTAKGYEGTVAHPAGCRCELAANFTVAPAKTRVRRGKTRA